MDQLSFKNAKILVVGDVMLDIYRHGKASRISPEAPVPVVLISREENEAGGAANVAVNLRWLGCNIIDLVGYIGQDYAGHQLMSIISHNKINPDNLIQSTAPTITKTRILADKQHVIRYDEDSAFDTSTHRKVCEDVMIQKLKDLSHFKSFDIVVVSDYAKGTITNKVMETIRSYFPCPIICDFKPVNRLLFHNVFCITPNLSEAQQLAVSFKYKNLFELATVIKQSLDVEVVIITLSQDGICLLDRDNKYHSFSAQTVNRPDVTGAGDTVLSTLAACLATGHNLFESVKLGNLAAAVVVGKTGTATCSAKELQNENLRM